MFLTAGGDDLVVTCPGLLGSLVEGLQSWLGGLASLAFGGLFGFVCFGYLGNF